jgi:hypothetical protein
MTFAKGVQVGHPLAQNPTRATLTTGIGYRSFAIKRTGNEFSLPILSSLHSLIQRAVRTEFRVFQPL